MAHIYMGHGESMTEQCLLGHEESMSMYYMRGECDAMMLR